MELLLLVTFVFVRVLTDLDTLASEELEDEVVPRLTVPFDERPVVVLFRDTPSRVVVALDAPFTFSRVFDVLELTASRLVDDLAVVFSRKEVLRPPLPPLRKEELLLSTDEFLPDE